MGIFLALLVLPFYLYWILLKKAPTSDKVIEKTKSIAKKTREAGSELYENFTTSKDDQIKKTDNHFLF